MKNVLNTGKKKVLAGAVAVALVAGTGFGLANTDAGSQLQAWYNKQFNSAQSQVFKDVERYGTTEALKALGEYEVGKRAHTNAIGAAGNAESAGGQAEIQSAVDGHIEAVNNTHATISGNIEAQFDGLLAAGIAELKKIESTAKVGAQTDLKAATNSATDSAVSKVNQDLEDAKNNAVSALEAAIANAKADLSAKLASESDTLTEEAKGEIDKAIGNVKTYVEGLAAEYLEESKAIVATAADSKVAEATDALDAIVSGINN